MNNTSQLQLQEKIDEIISEHADADMSTEELIFLLTTNGVDRMTATTVACDMHGLKCPDLT